jgi:hypothetical protein
MMKLLDKIGDWNPQLIREWQGRFQPWNVVGAFALSVLGQFIFWSTRYSKLPLPHYEAHPYCTGGQSNQYYGGGSIDGKAYHCLQDAANVNLVNWQLWWRDNFVFLTQCLVIAVIVAGVYLLISNLVYEERRGTLNFVRLSPRTNREIVLGKLLGVPILVYIALAVALPLHIWAAVQGKVPLSLLLGTYLVGAASCFFFYSGAILWSLTTSALGNLQPWVGAGFVAFTVGGLVNTANYNLQSPLSWVGAFTPTFLLNDVVNSPSFYRTVTWFNLPFFVNSTSVTVFSTVYFLGWSYWVWQAIDRRFRTPNATALSKAQSYCFTACLVGSLLGFAWREESTSQFSGYMFISFVMSLVVMMLITPNRQTLQEWARYRRSVPRSEQRSLLSDLLWGEKSPALLAVAVNMAIGAALLYVAIMRLSDKTGEIIAVAFMPLFLMGVILVLAAVFQVMLMWRTAKPALWAASTLGILLVCPVIGAGVFASVMPEVWLLTALPWLGTSLPVTTMLLGVLGQLSMFALLTYRLTRQLNQAGESASKALLNSAET